MPAKVESTPSLPGLSPVADRAIIARFDGGLLSSDGGVLALREVERRLGLADRLAACIDDPRAPERVRHGLAEIIRFRMLMIAAGYEDGNDADSLRHDPVFKLALERLPEAAALCSQPTISRLENLPGRRTLLRMSRARAYREFRVRKDIMGKQETPHAPTQRASYTGCRAGPAPGRS